MPIARQSGCLTVKKKANELCAKDRAMKRILLPIIALGGGLAATQAAALELGELTVHSNLGQPLRASIAYALAPNEVLGIACVSIDRARGGLPGIGGNTISITERAIIIAGKASIREPMLGMRVTVNCPFTPNLSRDYMLFVDPANKTKANEPVAQVTQISPVAKAAPMPAPAIPAPIGQSSRYQVKAGDTLSGIVSRIENRSIKLWPAVDAIFRANPDAFVNNDPNELKAGSWLIIPSLDGAVPVVAQAVPAAVADTPVHDVPAAASATESGTTTVYESTLAAEPPATEMPATEMPAMADTPAVEAADSNIIVPDTEVAGPETAPTSSDVPTAITSTDPGSKPASLIPWLIGGGFAVFASLYLFGRRARSRFASTPVGTAVNPSAIPIPEDTEKFEAPDDLDYEISDDSPTSENLALDADLFSGTGLGEVTGMDVAEDLGFAETTELDIELPVELQAEAGSETDIIPPMRQEMESILENEVLPEEDYDMSVILDATKMPHPEEVTERDLMAVPVGTDDETLISDIYTISREVDFDILEQDYEDEMAATQALNEEIARAAAELAKDHNLAVNDDDAVEMDIEGGTVNTRRA